MEPALPGSILVDLTAGVLHRVGGIQEAGGSSQPPL